MSCNVYLEVKVTAESQLLGVIFTLRVSASLFGHASMHLSHPLTISKYNIIKLHTGVTVCIKSGRSKRHRFYVVCECTPYQHRINENDVCW